MSTQGEQISYTDLNDEVLEKSGRLTAEVVKVQTISPAERQTLWALYSSYYDGATWESFNEDMNEKTHVVVARDSGDDSIQGFSTIKRSHQRLEGVNSVVLYSGDTIIHPDYWGQKALHMAFFSFLVKTRMANPFKKVVWFLLCNGFRTYLVFSRNIPSSWPRHDQETPEWEQKALASLALERFGSDFDAERGIVRFKNSLGLLKPNVAPIGKKNCAIRPSVFSWRGIRVTSTATSSAAWATSRSAFWRNSRFAK